MPPSGLLYCLCQMRVTCRFIIRCALFPFSIRDRARNSCAKLFMEIISEIIFSISSSTLDELPEDKLVSELIKSIIPSTDSTQQLSPLTDSKADEVPVVRSYLLQLLLDYEYVIWCKTLNACYIHSYVYVLSLIV